MTYKPQIVKGSFGPKGGAKCSWNKDHSKLQIVLGKDTVVFGKDDLPNNTFPSGEYYVQLSEDKKKLLAIRPNNGMFVVKTDRFVAKEGETPAPKTATTVEKESGREYSYQTFSVILKIYSPKEFADMELLFGTFKSVKLTPGTHRVKFDYRPTLSDFLRSPSLATSHTNKPSN